VPLGVELGFWHFYLWCLATFGGGIMSAGDPYVIMIFLIHLHLDHFVTWKFLFSIQTNFHPPVNAQPAVRPFVPAPPPVLRNAEQYQQPTTLGSQLYSVSRL